MPTIYDNIENYLHEELNREIRGAYAVDFCVGYFRMSGWDLISEAIDTLEGGKNKQCRLLIGMPFAENDRPKQRDGYLSKSEAFQIKSSLKFRLRRQLENERQTLQSETTLLKLQNQLKNQKLVVKVYTPEPLHAKLYLLYRNESKAKIVGYLGSSNLTFSGLKMQNELNVDILEQDAAQKLSLWFEKRWNNLYSLEITDDLIEMIDESWVYNQRPFWVYMKTVYHLCTDIREGAKLDLPEQFQNVLLPFQQDAFRRAVVKMEKGAMGAMIGDVVGLGKTVTASAIAKYYEEIHDAQVIVFCPPNLVQMWNKYSAEYKLKAKVFSHAVSKKEMEENELDKTGDFIIIDESHNFRNIKSKRYEVISAYIQKRRNANVNTRVLLLTATPYNKDYSDLYAQLSLIINPDERLPFKPDAEIKLQGGESFFKQKNKFEGRIDSLAAFAKSEQREDWRTLLHEFLIRRTRSFVKYSCEKDDSGKHYLKVAGKKMYFPERIPKNLTYSYDRLYAKLFSEESVELIASLHLPRYALGTYLLDDFKFKLNSEEQELVSDLKRAKTRLKGFCKTNFFKRLESCGHVFKLSLEHHLLRNQIFLYALNKHESVPIGTLELDVEESSVDKDAESYANEGVFIAEHRIEFKFSEILKNKHKFRWAPVKLFDNSLKEHLEYDCQVIGKLLEIARQWDPKNDQQLIALHRLVTQIHPDKKILVFSQFADTVEYLAKNLREMGVKDLAGITGDTDNPLEIVKNFSPKSNSHSPKPGEEIRILISSDVLSEGHNLQDCHVVVNYDLPWAIIRLTQRVGRVDRIGQSSDTVYCYSVVPEDGLENLIKLRARLQHRLSVNGEVIGTDEVFFEDDIDRLNSPEARAFMNLYAEKADALESQEGEENDLVSEAYKIWTHWTENGTIKDLEKQLKNMPMRSNSCVSGSPKGVIVYVYSENVDALRMFDIEGRPTGISPGVLLKKMQCKPEDPPLQRFSNHHELVELAVAKSGDYVGEPGGIKGSTANRVYEKLKPLLENSLFATLEEKQALDDIYRKPLTPEARNTLRLLLNLKLNPEVLLSKVKELYRKGKLTFEEDEMEEEIRVVCSMGLV